MAKEQKKIFAVDITRATTVGLPVGGSRDVIREEVLIVGTDISPDDAQYLVAIGKAVPCEPALKDKRAKAANK